MKILVINTGSSSLKYQLIDMKDESVIAKGLCDRIGIENSIFKYVRYHEEAIVFEIELKNPKQAIKEVLTTLTDEKIGVINSLDEIAAVGHRVVHGGEKFSDSVLIDDKVMDAIRECVELAPLHNPSNIVGIEACMDIMPNTKMAAVFDTAFHQTMPDYAYMYALPYEAYTKYRIRRYGFHGTSHKYVANRAAAMMGKPIEDLKIVTCHLGNGASICAVKGGKAVDTSMGFTPLEGLAMGTRSGDLDPAIVTFIMEKEKLSIDEINSYLNKKSGVLGISEVSSDFRDIENAINSGNQKARLAFDIFCYKVKKYIGAYAAVMGGIDCVVFTAGIGENTPRCRAKSVSNLQFLGIEIDAALNSKREKEFDISSNNAKVKTLVIATNEELSIARDTLKLIM